MNTTNIISDLPKSSGRLNNIEFLRCFAIISVVVLHTLCAYNGWQIYLPELFEAEGDTVYRRIYTFIQNALIPNANMPLFTAISGYVYYYLHEKLQKYSDTKEFIKSKAKRLLIPYFVLGPIVILTIYDWSMLKMISGMAHHLWYCLMLFWCFFFFRFFEKLPTYHKVAVFVLSILLQIAHLHIPIFALGRFLDFFPYFICGYYLYEYLPKLKNVYVIFAVIVGMILSYHFRVALPFKMAYLVYCYLYTLFFFLIVPQNIKNNSFITVISRYSFGIYIFHEWFLWNMAHISYFQYCIINYQLLYPLVAFVAVFGISTLLTHLSLKTRVGKFLLG